MPLSLTLMRAKPSSSTPQDDADPAALVRRRRARRCPRRRSSARWSAPATISRRSNSAVTGSAGRSSSKAMSGRPTRIRNSAWRTQSERSSRDRARLRHAGEGGEFVDHALDVVDLADDRVGALVEDVLALDDDAAVAALQPLGGKLDRRQRVLDLVGDAARDVGPGGAALGGDEFGDVVERDRRCPGRRAADRRSRAR